MSEATAEKTKTEPTAGGSLPSDLVSEIDASVDDAMTEIGASRVDEVEDDDQGEVEAPPPPPAADSDDDEDEALAAPAAGPSDELIERAVKAGIPLSEAKQYTNDTLLESMCARIEGASGTSGSQGGAGQASQTSEGDPAGVDDLLSAIPDLSPDDYDEQIVTVVKGMKEIVKRQNEIIDGLRSSQSQDWVATKLEGVKNFTKGDPDKESAVREKFGVLQAGYKAAGKDVPDSTVFDEAATLVLGGDMDAARQSAKARAARKRSGQRLQRPSGNRVTDKPDVNSEIADELDRKFFS